MHHKRTRRIPWATIAKIVVAITPLLTHIFMWATRH